MSAPPASAASCGSDGPAIGPGGRQPYPIDLPTPRHLEESGSRYRSKVSNPEIDRLPQTGKDRTMACATGVTWTIQPHTLAKHEILRRYLGAWFPIIASGSSRVVYIDGFCGPGQYNGGEPGSPIIALREALHHSQRLSTKELIFLFIDERTGPYFRVHRPVWLQRTSF